MTHGSIILILEIFHASIALHQSVTRNARWKNMDEIRRQLDVIWFIVNPKCKNSSTTLMRSTETRTTKISRPFHQDQQSKAQLLKIQSFLHPHNAPPLNHSPQLFLPSLIFPIPKFLFTVTPPSLLPYNDTKIPIQHITCHHTQKVQLRPRL